MPGHRDGQEPAPHATLALHGVDGAGDRERRVDQL
jgi:hypothetical protein